MPIKINDYSLLLESVVVLNRYLHCTQKCDIKPESEPVYEACLVYGEGHRNFYHM